MLNLTFNHVKPYVEADAAGYVDLWVSWEVDEDDWDNHQLKRWRQDDQRTTIVRKPLENFERAWGDLGKSFFNVII